MAFSDDFNRADNTDLGANWEENFGLSISSNQLLAGTGGGEARTASAGSPASADQFAEVDFVSKGSSGFPVSEIRARHISSAYNEFYGFRWQPNEWVLIKVVAGTTTRLGDSAENPTFPQNDVRIEVSGSSITCKVGGTTKVGPVTDTSITSHLRTGVSGGADATFDNFSNGDLGVSLAGSTTVDVTVAANVAVARPLSGSAAAEFAVIVNIAVARALAGATAATFDAATSLALARTLIGATDAAFGTTVDLTVTGPLATDHADSTPTVTAGVSSTPSISDG